MGWVSQHVLLMSSNVELHVRFRFIAPTVTQSSVRRSRLEGKARSLFDPTLENSRPPPVLN